MTTSSKPYTGNWRNLPTKTKRVRVPKPLLPILEQWAGEKGVALSEIMQEIVVQAALSHLNKIKQQATKREGEAK